MSSQVHDKQLLGAYVLDALDPAERTDAEDHLAGCAMCRSELAELEAVRDMLNDVPPEALLHGPPDADLVLQRTLRQVRTEKSAGVRQRRNLLAAAALIVLAGALGGGVAIGRGTSGRTIEAEQSTPATTNPRVPGTRVGSTVDPKTNARLTASLVPAAGWVRVNASVGNIPTGENCRLLVVGRDGTRETASGWIVSETGAKDGTNLDGAAAMAPENVVAIEVRNTRGKTFVTLPI